MENENFSEKVIEIMFRSLGTRISEDRDNFTSLITFIFDNVVESYEKHIIAMKTSLKSNDDAFSWLIKECCSRILNEKKVESLNTKKLGTDCARRKSRRNNVPFSGMKTKIDAEIERVEVAVHERFQTLEQEMLRSIESVNKSTRYDMDLRIADYDAIDVEGRKITLQHERDAYVNQCMADLENLKKEIENPNERRTHADKWELLNDFVRSFLKESGTYLESMGERMVAIETNFFEKYKDIHMLQINKFKEVICEGDKIRSFYGYMASEINNLIVAIDRIIGETLRHRECKFLNKFQNTDGKIKVSFTFRLHRRPIL